MKSIRVLAAAVAGLVASQGFAACDEPSMVLIPAQEDLAGKEREVVEATQAYFQAMQEYVECIKREIESAGEDAPDTYRNVLIRRNNAAVAEAEAVQRWFNSRFPAAATVPAGLGDE